MAKGETKRKLPKLLLHLWHDRVNMEFAEACMQAMLWHQDMGGRFNDYLYTEAYKGSVRSRHSRLLQGQPSHAGAAQAVPRMFYEKCRELSYYSNLGLFGK
jgi:hypothetical protein